MSRIVDEGNAFWENEKKNLPEKAVTLIEEGIAYMESDAFVLNPIPSGTPAPSFSLLSHTGERIESSKLYAESSVVLFFYRGEWCPFCNLQLKAYMEQISEFEALGAKLVAVSPERPDYSLTTVEKSGVSFDILHDENNALAKDFGVAASVPKEHVDALAIFDIDLTDRHGTELAELPTPGVFVIKEGVVTECFFDYNYRVRAEVEDILKALR